MNGPFQGSYSLVDEGTDLDQFMKAEKLGGAEAGAAVGGAGALAGLAPAGIMVGGMLASTLMQQKQQREAEKIKNEMERRQRMQELIQAGSTNIGNALQNNLSNLGKALL